MFPPGEAIPRGGAELAAKVSLWDTGRTTTSAALLSTGARVLARTIVTTVSSGQNPLLETLPVELQRGRMPVDAHLAVPGLDRDWALGDCAAVTDVRTGRLVPPTAQHATREARCAADNALVAIAGGRRLRSRSPRSGRWPRQAAGRP